MLVFLGFSGTGGKKMSAEVLIPLVGTTLSVIIALRVHDFSVKKELAKQKEIEKQKDMEKILSLFEKRDLILQEQTKEIKHNIELTIQKNIMPLIKAIQEQQKNLQDQVNTIMNELIDNTKTTNKRLTQLEIQTAINSVKKEQNVK